METGNTKGGETPPARFRSPIAGDWKKAMPLAVQARSKQAMGNFVKGLSMIEHLSYSSISLYLECAEAWRRKYIAKEPTASSPALIFGRAFHETIEAAVTLTNVNLQSVWMERYPRIAREEKNIVWGDETPEAQFNEGVRLLSDSEIAKTILSIKPQRDEYNMPMIEKKVELRVPGVPLPIIGYVDIITEDGTPADFKTSSKSWSDGQASGSMQTLFYIAAMNQMGIPVNWKFRHYIFVKTKTPKVQTLEHAHKAGELFFLFSVIANAWKGIEREVFPLNPNSWKCSLSYCDFFQQCRGKYG